MISIKKFLSGDDPKPNDAFERMSHLLLQAIGLHAAEGSDTVRSAFQAAIDEFETGLTGDPSPANVMLTSGAVVKAMDQFNRRNSAQIQSRHAGMQSMVVMLTQAMSQISTASQTSVARLHEFQHLIEGAAMVDSMITLKSRLSECLQSIRGESERQQGESERMVAELKNGLKKSQAQLEPAASGSDSVTGVPLRAEAEAATEAACGDGSRTYAALFVVERLETIKARFGREIGEQVESRFVERVSSALAGADKMFRWSPVSFLALLEREECDDHVRREVAKVLSRPFDQIFEMTNRSVVLPISSTWVVVPLFESSYPQILSKLKMFCSRSGLPGRTA